VRRFGFRPHQGGIFIVATKFEGVILARGDALANFPYFARLQIVVEAFPFRNLSGDFGQPAKQSLRSYHHKRHTIHLHMLVAAIHGFVRSIGVDRSVYANF